MSERLPQTGGALVFPTSHFADFFLRELFNYCLVLNKSGRWELRFSVELKHVIFISLGHGFFSFRLTILQINGSQIFWLSQSPESLLNNPKLISHSVFISRKL